MILKIYKMAFLTVYTLENKKRKLKTELFLSPPPLQCREHNHVLLIYCSFGANYNVLKKVCQVGNMDKIIENSK